MIVVQIVNRLDECPYNGIAKRLGYSCDQCGEYNRNDCPGIGGGKVVAEYEDIDKAIKKLKKLKKK